MVKFNVSFLLAAMIASHAAAGYTTTQSTTKTDAMCEQDVDVPDTCDGSDGWYPVSVVGKEGYYCTKGPICAGESGICPGARRDLIYGSSCVSLGEGIYGCAPKTECSTESIETDVHDDCEVIPDNIVPEVTTETPYYPHASETTTVPPPVYTPDTATVPPQVYTPEAQQSEETPAYGWTQPPTDKPEQRPEDTPVYDTTEAPTDALEQQTEETSVYNTTASPTYVPEQQTEETLAQTNAPTLDSEAPPVVESEETMEPETSTLSDRSLRLN